MPIDVPKLRRFAVAAQRMANALPNSDPEKAKLNRAAGKVDDLADLIDGLGPEMRADLEVMFASVRPN